MYTHEFYLWPGSGYCLDGPWAIESDRKDYCEQEIEQLVAKLFELGLEKYYTLTDEEYDKLCRDCNYDREEMEDDLEGWRYIDATMEGAPYPVYLRTENFKHRLAS